CNGDRHCPARPVRRARYQFQEFVRRCVSRKVERRCRLHQRWIFRRRASRVRLHRRRRHDMGARPARDVRSRGETGRLSAHGLLAKYGYASRQECPRGPLENRECTMENMVDPPPASSGTPRNGETSKILVTGAEGYIGYILSSRLLSIGYDVTGLDTGFYN